MAEGPASEGLDRLARDVLDNGLEGYQVISPELRYLYLNDAAVRHARAPRAALLGRTMGEVHPGIEHTPMFTVLQRCMKQRDTVHMENAFTYPDGRTCWFELRFIAVPQGVLVCSVEITERRRTEGELLRSRRVLGVISESNQALVRASDEHELMREVCRIAVERGGYRMAWIGNKEHDDARSIRPVTSAGVDDGYTDALQLSWDEAQPRGQGPTGRAVREGEVAIARFLSSDPFFDPWREAAPTRGLASSIALPFRVDGAACGALCIYSGEPDAFDAHETRLLEEVALDLGHGVQALRARAASQRSAAQLAYLNERLKRLARVLQAFSRTRGVEAMLRLVCSAARELANADAATFALAQGDSCVFVEEDAEVPFWKGRRVPMSECIGGCVIRQRETVVVHELAADPRISAEAERPPGVCSLAMVPIRREDPIGAIAVCWSTPHRATEDDLGLLETLADSVAIQMERLRMLGELTESEVHLPRVEGRVSPSGRPPGPEPSARGDETILVVEDDDAVRAIAERVLRGAGYHVTGAEDCAQALRIFEQRGDSVDLLLTDVVMPKMSGKQLAQRMIEQRPALRVLFMSGSTDNIIAPHGVLEPGTLFIGKPFSARDLAKKVRSALDSRGERA